MVRNRKFTHRRLTLLALSLGLLALIAWSYVINAAPLTIAQQLQHAWRQASAIGQYQYQTDVLQTIHPTAKLENAGRQTQTQTLTVEGEMNRPGEAMTLCITNGNAGSTRVIDLRVAGGVDYGRTDPTAEWVKVDTETELFALGGNLGGDLGGESGRGIWGAIRWALSPRPKMCMWLMAQLMNRRRISCSTNCSPPPIPPT